MKEHKDNEENKKNKNKKKVRKISQSKLWKERLIHLGINLIIYFSVFLIKDTGSGMMILLVLIPMSIAINSLIYSLRVKYFDVLYALLTAILFIPFVFLVMNDSAWIYALVFLGISGLLNFVGSLISRGMHKQEVEEDLKEEIIDIAEESEEIADDVIDFIDNGL